MEVFRRSLNRRGSFLPSPLEGGRRGDKGNFLEGGRLYCYRKSFSIPKHSQIHSPSPNI